MSTIELSQQLKSKVTVMTGSTQGLGEATAFCGARGGRSCNFLWLQGKKWPRDCSRVLVPKPDAPVATEQSPKTTAHPETGQKHPEAALRIVRQRSKARQTPP